MIISGFPGIGKSTSVELMQILYKHIKVYDLDSSSFSWIIKDNGEKIRNPNFIKEYIDYITSINNDNNTIILISSHNDVINSLLINNVNFTLVYPNEDRKEEFMDTYYKRELLGHPLPVSVVQSQWNNWIKSCKEVDCNKVELLKDHFFI